VGAGDPVPAPQEGPQAAGRHDPVEARGRLTAEGLPRSYRVTRAAELRALLAQGKRRRTDHLDLFTRPSPVGRSRLAVVVPRHRHTAVRRNRLRRRIREIGRRYVLPTLGMPTDVGIRARPAAYDATFERLRQEIVTALCPSSPASSSC
jgi:ribonuclease P protein component